MNSYTVLDVAKLVGKNPETVRRWIRSGKLKAAQSSRKDGNVVLEDDLYCFLRSSAKYTGLAAGMLATNSMLAITTVVAGILGSVVASKATSKKDLEIIAEDVRKTLNDKISESEEIIEKRKSTIAELQAEIEVQEKQIEDCRIALEHLPQEVFVVSEGGANVDRE